MGSPTVEVVASETADDAAARARWRILALVCVGQFMVIVDDTIVNVALPSIRTDLGFTEQSLAWVVNAYLLMFGGLLLVGGRATDLFGRRRMFAVGIGCFTACSLVCGLADASGLLVGARGLQGLAGAILSPAALAIVLATFPEGADRTKALGVWAGLTGLGAATGVVAGGAIVELLSWRWVFFVNVPIGLAALALTPRVIPAVRRNPAAVRSLDLPGALAVTAGTLALVYTVIETHTHGWTSVRTIAGFAVALGLALAFAARERRAACPLVPLDVVSRRPVAWSNVLMLIAAAGLFALFFFLTLYMQMVQGWSALRTGLSYLPFSLTVAITSGAVAKAMSARQIQPRVLVSIGALVGAGGFVLMTRIEAGGAYWSELLPALLVTAVGLGLAFVPLTTAATSGAGDGTGGLASGLLASCQQVGGAVGIAVLVTVANDRATALAGHGHGLPDALTGGFHAAFAVAAGLLVAAALVAPLIGRVRVDGRGVPL